MSRCQKYGEWRVIVQYTKCVGIRFIVDVTLINYLHIVTLIKPPTFKTLRFLRLSCFLKYKTHVFYDHRAAAKKSPSI